MIRLRKIWKVIAGVCIACALIGVYFAYVNASTEVSLSMTITSKTIDVPYNTTSDTFGVNVSGTDDNSTNADKSPMVANISWKSTKPTIANVNAATGSSTTVTAYFAGITTVSATYYSGGIATGTPVGTPASINVRVPLVVTPTSSYSAEKIYTGGDLISFNANTCSDNKLGYVVSNTGVVELYSLTDSSVTFRVVGGGSATITLNTADGLTSQQYVVKSKVNFTGGTVIAGGERVLTLDSTPGTAFANELVDTNVISPASSGVTWISSDTSILSICKNTDQHYNGYVKGGYAGVTTLKAGILATDVGNNTTLMAGTYDTITVVVPFKWLNSVENMNVNDSFKLLCSGKPSELTWATSDNSVLSVGTDGTVTAVGSGTATITVSRPTDDNNQTNRYNEKYSLQMTIQVIDSFSLSTTSQEINIGDTYVLKALTTTSSATVSYSVTNVAEVGKPAPTYNIVTTETSADGKSLTIKGAASGTVRIVATQNIKGLIKTAECLIYVRTPVGQVTLNPSSLAIDRGSSDIIQLIFNPSSPYNNQVLWTSSDTSVATVTGDSATATIVGLKGGTSTISVITMDGLKVASCDVSVREPVTGVTLNQTSVDAAMASGSYQLSATVLPAGNGVNRNVSWTSSDTSIVTVDTNGLVKFVKPGYATIICRTIDGSYMATCNFFVRIPVTSVGLNYSNETMSLDKTLQLTATVLPITATNRTVSWTSSNTKVLAVDSNGLVKAVGTGNATILCTSLDDGTINAMCNIYVKQPATSVVLNTTSTTVRKGQVFWLNATVLPENADNKIVAWSSTKDTVAKVDADGKVTALEPGIVTIIATNTDTGLTGYCVVTITQPVTGITLNSNYQELWVGSKYAIIPTVLPIDAENKKVKYLSSDATVASVDENGIVTAVKGGKCVITVTTEECSLIASVSIDVKEYVSSITLNATSKLMNIGTASDLTATVGKESATNRAITWTSSNPGVVSVDQKGHIYAASEGTAVITATANDGSGVSASCPVRSVEPVTSVSVEPGEMHMLVGDSQRAHASVSPGNASIKDVTWVSSNPAAATVDAEGEVFAVGIGKSIITAVSSDGNNVKGTCSVYVTPVISIKSLKINSSEISMLSGKTRQLTARITPTNTTESHSWYSTDTSVVVVDNSGRITTVGPGTADIVLTGGLNNVESKCIVHSMAISQSSIRIEQYDAFDLAVDGATKTVTWRTGNPRVATVTSAGHIVARMAGTTTVTATVDGKTLTCVVRVTNIK